MHNLQDIENMVAELPPEQLAEFRAWFETFDAPGLTPAQAEELHRRIDAFEKGELPPGEPWDKVKVWLQNL